MSGKGNLKTAGLLLCAAAFAIILWCYLLIRPQICYEEVMVESGCSADTSFTAVFPTITAIVPNNEDPALEDLLEENPIAVAVSVFRGDGSLAGKAFSDSTRIHTNGYISTEACHLEGLPIELTVGETYTLRYEAVCGERGLPNLSFALYGNTKNYRTYSILMTMAGLLLCIGLFVFIAEGGAHWFLLVWFLVMIPYIWTMPLEHSGIEADRFAGLYQAFDRGPAENIHELAGDVQEPSVDVYELAGDVQEPASGVHELAGGVQVTAADLQKSVNVRESGLRNLAYLSYSVPLHRFWNDWGYGNVRTDSMTGSLYQNPASKTDPAFLLRAAAVKAARHFRLPYQVIYFSGTAASVLVSVILMLRILAVSKKIPALQALWMGIWMLPSYIRNVLYHSGNSFLILAVMMLLSVYLCRKTAALHLSEGKSSLGRKAAELSSGGKIFTGEKTAAFGVILIIWNLISWIMSDGRQLIGEIREDGAGRLLAPLTEQFGWNLDTLFKRILFYRWTDKNQLLIAGTLFLACLIMLLAQIVREVRIGSGSALRKYAAVMAVVSFFTALQYFL